MQMRVRITMSADAGNCTNPQLRAAELLRFLPCCSSVFLVFFAGALFFSERAIPHVAPHGSA
jgi:hypothetical protein